MTAYEDMRSRILYTCEEKYDGSMVAYVIDLESQLTALRKERDQLMKDVSTSCECCVFIDVNSSEEPCSFCMKHDYCHFRWRGIQDQKGSEQE